MGAFFIILLMIWLLCIFAGMSGGTALFVSVIATVILCIILAKVNSNEQSHKNNTENTDNITTANIPPISTQNDNSIKCSRCGSTQIHSDRRGWKVTTGLLGSSKIICTCLKCGNQWKAGKTTS